MRTEVSLPVSWPVSRRPSERGDPAMSRFPNDVDSNIPTALSQLELSFLLWSAANVRQAWMKLNLLLSLILMSKFNANSVIVTMSWGRLITSALLISIESISDVNEVGLCFMASHNNTTSAWRNRCCSFSTDVVVIGVSFSVTFTVPEDRTFISTPWSGGEWRATSRSCSIVPCRFFAVDDALNGTFLVKFRTTNEADPFPGQRRTNECIAIQTVQSGSNLRVFDDAGY